jgi:hypothetical protein
MARAAVLRSLFLAALGACGDTAINQPPDAIQISLSCIEAADHSDLEWIQDEIFTKSCSRFSSCHKGNATSAARLNLEEGNAFERLVGVPSRVCGGDHILVVPGDPAASYLMKVINPDKYPLPDPVGPGTSCPEGDPDEPPESMPYNNPLLCEQKRDAIERWIVSLPADTP